MVGLLKIYKFKAWKNMQFFYHQFGLYYSSKFFCFKHVWFDPIIDFFPHIKKVFLQSIDNCYLYCFQFIVFMVFKYFFLNLSMYVLSDIS